MRKYIKNVNKRNAFNTILFCLLAILVAFIPFTIGSSASFSFYFETFPLIGDNSFGDKFCDSTYFLFDLLYYFDLSFLDVIAEFLEIFVGFLPIIFYGIIALDLIFSILLLIFRQSWLRKIFKILSIIMGIVMVVITLLYLTFLVGIILNAIIDLDFFALIDEYGLFAILFTTGFSMVATVKQFTWFKKLY